MEFRRAGVAGSPRSWRRYIEFLSTASVHGRNAFGHLVVPPCIRARTKRAPFPALFSTRHVHLRVFRVRIRPGSDELPARPEGAKGYLDISKRLVSAMGCRRNREITEYWFYFHRTWSFIKLRKLNVGWSAKVSKRLPSKIFMYMLQSECNLISTIMKHDNCNCVDKIWDRPENVQ